MTDEKLSWDPGSPFEGPALHHHHPRCLDKDHDPGSTQCRIPMVKRPMAQERPTKPPPISTHYGPKFEVTLKLDPGQLAELVELVMPLRMVLPPVDPEAEAADLLAIQRERQKERAEGARRERQRLIVLLRDQAVEWSNMHSNVSVTSALNSLAMKLEADQS